MASADDGRGEYSTSRYRDAYAVAESIISNGFVFKVIGFLVAAASAGSFLVMVAQTGLDFYSFAPAVPAMVSMVGAALYGLGVLMSASGQALRAVCDTAVHTRRLVGLETSADHQP